MTFESHDAIDRVSGSELSSRFGFPLDDFQIEAIRVVESGESVVVSAPTGSGKTVIAEFAIQEALKKGHRAFYTAPIKALSNQKFNDLTAMFGSAHVGLLTGDNVVNSDAPIVVMTTEVLRNMLYARSSSLDLLSTVILDEVHFIQDEYRGPVWEEVIIHLPQNIQLVCLSATVSNAPEVADWMTTVRGRTRFVIEEKRPVELEVSVMVGDRSGEDHLLPIFAKGGVNPRLAKLAEGHSYRKSPPKHGSRRPLVTPKRSDVIERLKSEDLLPTIFFIFSRQGCEEAASATARDLPSLTTAEERRRILAILEQRTADMSADDLEALGFRGFQDRLSRGIAPHHAGMVPPFKEVVESCFAEGLVKVVFATETLAVGINMPARSVVIDKLTKFTGEHHQFLSAGQFTQLTGRAGRRGLDDRGHAVLLWSPFVTLDQMAGLAASKSFRLTSSFRPTFNMAVNLVRSYPRETARHLLNSSLAQFQSDKSVVTLESRLERRIREMRDLEASLHTEFGSPEDYLALAASADRAVSDTSREDTDRRIAALRPGDVLHVAKGPYRGLATVMSTTRRSRGWKITVLSTRRSLLQLGTDDFLEPPIPVGSIDMPTPFAPTRQDFQRKVVDRMARAAKRRPARQDTAAQTSDAGRNLPDPDRQRRASAVEADPRLVERLAVARRVLRMRKEIPGIRDDVDRRSSSISRAFDRVLDILDSWSYVNGWSLTSKGESLSRLFHESDLLIAECLHRDVMDDLDPPTLAAIVSVFVYEHRSSTPAPAPWFPSKEARSRWKSIEAISSELRRMETDNGVPPHRGPDPTFASVAYSWASGEDFAQIIDDEELSGGDFVRNIKQLIDLLRQISVVAPVEMTRIHAARACALLQRGVVEASSSFAEST